MSKTTDPLAWTALAEEDYLLARSALRMEIAKAVRRFARKFLGLR